jgi:hypothetical protein
MSGWEHLGRVPPTALSDARRAFHHAAQIVSSVGITFLPAAADDSHTNMEWTESLRALAGRPAGDAGFRLAARPEGLRLVLLDRADRDVESLALSGRTIEEGFGWAAGAIARLTRAPERRLSRPSWTIPPLGRDRFRTEIDDPALAELARWYGNAAHVLNGIAEAFDGSSPVRCWPHHFDIATLLPGGAPDRTVGVGLSPGDSTYPEPYWYVSPYPYPKDPDVRTLPEGGRWHRKDFFAAVLTGTALLEGGSERLQEARSRSFLEEAVSACVKLLQE